MKSSTRWWLVPVAALILLSFVLPFTVFTDVDAWYGSFLFWVLATAAVIGINAVVSAEWRD